MIAQKNRLKKADFEPIFKNGSKIYSPQCLIRYRGNGLNYCRFSVVVSNKVSKKAVIRNRLRRRFKAVFVENLSNFKQNIDIVVIVLPACANLSFNEIKDILLNLLKKHRLLV